jgi:hypothetical protein
MTQFLLWTSTEQPPDGYVAMETHEIGCLRLPAACIFPNANAIVKVAPFRDELDSVVDEAREKMLAGLSVQSTRLGVLLETLASLGSFALFWGSDYEDLPIVCSLEDLWNLLSEQIRVEYGNWELYVLYKPM